MPCNKHVFDKHVPQRATTQVSSLPHMLEDMAAAGGDGKALSAADMKALGLLGAPSRTGRDPVTIMCVNPRPTRSRPSLDLESSHSLESSRLSIQEVSLHCILQCKAPETQAHCALKYPGTALSTACATCVQPAPE